MGYVDRVPGGHTATFATAEAWAKRENAVALSITTDADLTADIFDIESGAEPLTRAPEFYALQAGTRPIFYTAGSNVDALTAALLVAGIARARYRILSAHYGIGEHICGPHTCGVCTTTCDGTQWDGTAGGADTYDISALRATFFNTPEEDQVRYGIVEYEDELWSVFATAGQVKRLHLSPTQVTCLTALGAERLSGSPWTATNVATLPIAAA